jgi:hypothetical protein
MRTTKVPKTNTRCFAMFLNPGGRIKKGDLVSIVLGEVKLEHMKLD